MKLKNEEENKKYLINGEKLFIPLINDKIIDFFITIKSLEYEIFPFIDKVINKIIIKLNNTKR